MQCPECGQETPQLVQGACAECASRHIKPLEAPLVLKITTCAHCGRVEDGKHWVQVQGGPEAVLMDRLHKAIRVHADVDDAAVEIDTQQQDPRNLRAEVRLTGTFHGHAVADAAQIQVRLARSVCLEDSRKHGGYFEAVLQVRGHPDRPLVAHEAVRSEVEKALEPLSDEDREGAYFSDVQPVRGGIDFSVGSHEVARVLSRRLAQRWGATVRESATLVGRTDDGQDMYRVTIILRLPAWRRGDFVELEGRVAQVVGVKKKSLRLRDLDSWDDFEREPGRVKGLKRVAEAADVKKAVLVSRTAQGLQVLDPDSMLTVDLAAPGPVDGDEVEVVRHDGRLWLVPPAHARQ